MSVYASINDESPVASGDFPKLMKGKNRGNIYLMESATAGTIVALGPNPGKSGIGTYRDDFDPSKALLTDFFGTVELSSD